MMVEEKKIFKFLLGLNKNLDEVRERLMGTKPLPSCRETLFEVHQEKSRKKLMMGTQDTTPMSEGSALVT